MTPTVLRIISGSANPRLAGSVANHLGVDSDGCTLERYPDGELRPTVENVCGADVHVVQPTAPPVNDHIIELLLLLPDACRRARAARVSTRRCKGCSPTGTEFVVLHHQRKSSADNRKPDKLADVYGNSWLTATGRPGPHAVPLLVLMEQA